MNWDARAVPTTSDDVVIDVATNPTVTTTGSITIKSLISNEALRIQDGTFKVTAGSSQINAASRSAPGPPWPSTGPGRP